MNETLIAVIALAIGSAQTDHARKIERDKAARAEPIKLIGKPLTPLHPIPILPALKASHDD